MLRHGDFTSRFSGGTTSDFTDYPHPAVFETQLSFQARFGANRLRRSLLKRVKPSTQKLLPDILLSISGFHVWVSRYHRSNFCPPCKILLVVTGGRCGPMTNGFLENHSNADTGRACSLQSVAGGAADMKGQVLGRGVPLI